MPLDNVDYSVLPEESEGIDADNPDVFVEWLNPTCLNPPDWPYVMLCRDLDNDSLTWHMLCDEYNIPRIIQSGLKSQIDAFMKGERKRNLRGVELVCRYNNKHIFVDSEE